MAGFDVIPVSTGQYSKHCIIHS